MRGTFARPSSEGCCYSENWLNLSEPWIGKSSIPGNLVLLWGRSCRSSDTDYAVYEGLLGNFTSHAPRLCGTGGATSATLTPASGNRYYLVVPLSPDGAEGSYGTGSNGIQRPPSATGCRPQVFTGCQ
jgi:hypothetical protein